MPTANMTILPARLGGVNCSPGNPQVFGNDQIKSADQVRQERANRNDWPYEHLFPPSNSVPVNQITQTPVAVPAMAATAVVLAYRVPSGMRFIMTALVQNIFGATFLPGDGTWTVDKNTPVGIPDAQRMPMQGLVNVPVPLGSFQTGIPWHFTRPYEFEPLDLVQSKFTNATSGATLLVSAFLGYLIPVTGLTR